jgi:hypothetical protein
MANNIGAFQRKNPHGFGEKPVKADHYANFAWPYIKYRKISITRTKPKRFFIA